jgi:UTP--glucose-1-phosphate uridylyltransferase
VPRTRFAPVKKTGDLLAVRSDAYELTASFCIVPNPARTLPEPPVVNLDEAHYRLIDAFEARFPAGAPSLLHCEALTIIGDVIMGEGVEVHGRVTIHNPDPTPRTISHQRLTE